MERFVALRVIGLSAVLVAALSAQARATEGAIRDLVVTDLYAVDKEGGTGRLEQAGPATITFTLAEPAEVVIDIHADANYEPKLIRTLRLGRKDSGEVTARWDGRDDKGEPVREEWRTYSCTVKAGNEEAMAFWAMPSFEASKGKSPAPLSVVPGVHLLLAEGDQRTPFALQVFNAGNERQSWKVEGAVDDPDKSEVLKVACELVAPPMGVAARTFDILQKRNGICTGRFLVAPGGGAAIAVETTFGRVRPHRKRFERDSAFASVWVSGCRFADAIGIKMSRQNDVYWTLLQKKPDEAWNWGDPLARGSTLDGFLTDREKHHMWMLSILGYGEDWLGGSFMGCTIYNYDRFVNDYCVEVMRHMKGHHDLLQFWNEPNCFWHVPMDQYYLVQQRVFSRIKTLDRGAFIMGDGHTGAESNNAFVARMAELGYAPYTTALAVHYPEPTVEPGAPEGASDSKAENLFKLFDLRDKFFPAVEIWNTEDGLWFDRRCQQDASAAAGEMTKVYVTQIAAGVERVFWFAMAGEQHSMHDLTHLLRPGGKISETAIAYANMTYLLEGATFMGYLSPQKGIRQYLFANAGKPVIVAWSNVGETKQSVFVSAKEVELLDLYGNATPLATTDARAEVTLTATPVYIVGANPLLLIDALNTERAESATPQTLLTDAPALMKDIRKAAAGAGVGGEEVAAFSRAWNEGIGKLNFVFQSFGQKPPPLGENHPSVTLDRMMGAAAKLRRAFETACAGKQNLSAALTGLWKLDCLLERAAEVMAIWAGASDGRREIAAAKQALDAAEAALARAEGDEYKPAARSYLSQLQKVVRKAERACEDGLGGAAAARAKLAAASATSIAAIAGADPSAIISCVVNVYVNPERKRLDRFMTLFARNVVPGLPFPVEVDIDNYVAKARAGKLRLSLPPGWQCTPAEADVTLKESSLATATTFAVKPPAGAELKKEYRIGALFEAGELKVAEAFPVTVTTVPPLEVAALLTDDADRPRNVVARIICNIETLELKVKVAPPPDVELASDEIVLGPAKPGSVRYPHFPLVRYAPSQEYAFEVTATARPADAGATRAESRDHKELKLKLAGDGRPAADEILAWDRTLKARDFCDFSKDMGNWQASSPDVPIGIEDGAFVGRASRREFVRFAGSPEMPEEFTIEMDVCLTGHGLHCNGAPLVIGTRQKRPDGSTDFRAMLVNTYAREASIADRTWVSIGEKVPFKGDPAEIAAERWMHIKVAFKGDEIWAFFNDWPVHRYKGPRLEERYLALQNGYANDMRVDNILIRYGSR